MTMMEHYEELDNKESNYVEEFTIKEEFSEVKSDAEEDQNNEEGSEPTKKRLKRNCHSSKISYEEEENSLPENNIESDETKNLIPHIESVHEKIKHPCSICDKILSSKKQLRYHIDGFHEGKTPHKCSTCVKSFATKKSLNRHILQVHEKIKPFNCQECGKNFGQKVNLIGHIQSRHKPNLDTTNNQDQHQKQQSTIITIPVTNTTSSEGTII